MYPKYGLLGVVLGIYATRPKHGVRATLENADLRGAALRDVDPQDIDLRGADLRGADLRGADLRDGVSTASIIMAIGLRR